jgi:hypothetical protein
LNVANPIADDEGIDLVFYHRGSSDKAIFAQVKSATAKPHIRCDVRRATFKARANYALIFVAFNHKDLRAEAVWYIPSLDFEERLKNQKQERKVFVFDTRLNSTADMWREYRCDELKQLPQKILDDLGAGG